jgi:hypothetical protein
VVLGKQQLLAQIRLPLLRSFEDRVAILEAVAVARKQVSNSWVPPVRERSGKDLLVVLRSATHLTETHKPVAVVVVPVE